MKALCIYLCLGCLSINIAGNMMAKTAEALEQRQGQRMEAVCEVNPSYCE